MRSCVLVTCVTTNSLKRSLKTQTFCARLVRLSRLPYVLKLQCGQRRRISLPVRGAGYELLIPFREYSAELKRERNQRSLSIRLATAKTSDAKRFSLTDNPLRGAFGIAPLCTLLAFGLDFVLGTILNCLFDLTTRPTTHYLESGISMRWQMGIQGGHCDFIELFTWWRNPWP